MITAADVHQVATTGTPHLDGRLSKGELTHDDLIAMTEPGDWTGDWDDLTESAAQAVADDLNTRYA